MPRRIRRMAARLAGPGLAVTYLSLLVLLPLAAVLSSAFSSGPGAFWQAVSQPEAVAALRLTLLCSLAVAAVNSVLGSPASRSWARSSTSPSPSRPSWPG
jgi:sulfate transport system permease protein